MNSNALMAALVYGPPTQTNQNFFTTQVQNLQSYIQTKGITDPFFTDIARLHQQHQDARITDVAKSMLMQVDVISNIDIVRILRTVEEMQTASPLMVRFIMANPEIRTRWQDNRCYGYGEDMYNPSDRNSIGSDHYDYRLVMDGVGQKQEDGSVRVQHYTHTLQPNDQQLGGLEKAAIATSWEVMNQMLLAAAQDDNFQDPTSPFGDLLG